MTVTVRSQQIAQTAFQCVEARQKTANSKKYLSFARSFPTLVHTNGLAQAVAFAKAKGVKEAEKNQLLDDLAEVIHAVDNSWMSIADGDSLDEQARATSCEEYMRLTRLALQSATWLKRYAEALMSTAKATPENAGTDNGEQERCTNE